jgi:hypothetical protein
MAAEKFDLSMERRPVTIQTDQFLAESLAIVEAAQRKNIVVRILGGFAIYVHSDKCPECRTLQLSLGRLGEGKPAFTDLDLAGYNKQWNDVKNFFEKECKLKPDRMVNALFGGNRLVYFHPKANFPIDVFFDKLEFSHDVSFGEYKKNGRLELDYPTLNLADLILEKLQIHQINKKDLIDILVLLLGHEVSAELKPDTIDAGYIASILSDDWGFWFDATNNLNHAAELGRQFVNEQKISQESWQVMSKRLDQLSLTIANREKTPKWKIREKVGTKKPWYTEVGEL